MTEIFEKALLGLLPDPGTAVSGEEELASAMRWAVEGGGKRIRPRLCMAAAVAAGGRAEDALMPACAIELLHSYTLVHDDLPAMDDDGMRRGKPSVWAKYGESAAILAGDALQSLAFAAAAKTPRRTAETVAVLARAASEVVAGQAGDLFYSRPDNAAKPSAADVERVFARKTGALFAAAAEMGALAADADTRTAERLRAFGIEAGLAFQYADDLLDDADGSFSSLPAIGRERVASAAAEHAEKALRLLDDLPGDASQIRLIASRIVSVKKV